MLCSEKSYRSEEEVGSSMSEISALLKAWMEESRKREERHQEERKLFEKARVEEWHQYMKSRDVKTENSTDSSTRSWLEGSLNEGRSVSWRYRT